MLVATPIGNLGDITRRAVEALANADLVLAEDTRRTGLLLKHLSLHKRLQSCNDQNESKVAATVVERIARGEQIALVSDAGTPGLSDPGYRVIRSIIDAGLPLEVLPGPTAVTTALLHAGLPFHRFAFEGFLPIKGRSGRLTALAAEERTMVFFEAPHRIGRTLSEMETAFGSDRPAALCRELTKLHEEVFRGTLGELRDICSKRTLKGEIVLVVGGCP
ncbi:MAG: 16S rRNA (cytidine(1402)-2'-O)-methyltransferase [Calditrichaeota bacterium]|nr:16S rRNA (cytidine(1402)-2'-O)-methyltransferase [Calditrichota bacterium]